MLKYEDSRETENFLMNTWWDDESEVINIQIGHVTLALSIDDMIDVSEMLEDLMDKVEREATEKTDTNQKETPQVSSRTEINKKELKKYMESVYEVKTVVQLQNEAHINNYFLDQKGLDDLLVGYEEYGEFLIEVKKI